MSFHPPGATVPDELRTALLCLRPLRVADVVRDYAAVMSSAAMLRRWSQSDWPADDFTLAENRADLERHEREHAAGEAFTFTVLDPSGETCLGCVYLQPLAAHEAPSLGGAHVVKVGFWVRESEIARDLDRHLLASLIEWLDRAWAFDAVRFVIADTNERQATLLAECGLRAGAPYTLADGRTRVAYG